MTRLCFNRDFHIFMSHLDVMSDMVREVNEYLKSNIARC